MSFLIPSALSKLRADFPVLDQTINGKQLIYFDNAATTQKPQAVLEAMTHYYEQDNANVHRAVHTLSVRATERYEGARSKIKRYINAKSETECIFVRGCTEAINLVAQSYVLPQLQAGDEILLSQMEHHANIVPWYLIAKKAGARLRVAPISLEGEILLEAFEAAINEKTRFVALNHASNVLGSINPVKKMIDIAHAKGVKVLLDGAQAAAHLPVDVQDLGCDFYAFSAHKMYGPTGIGLLWGREALLEAMPPYQGGGEMIRTVDFDAVDFAALPQKFEAGTPNIAGAVGFGAAVDYLSALDLQQIHLYENKLLDQVLKGFDSFKRYRLIGLSAQKVPLVSFVHESIHPHDMGTIFDSEAIAVRSGHHCAMPLMEFYKLPATVRLSLSFYNTPEEIDRFFSVLERVEEVFL